MEAEIEVELEEAVEEEEMAEVEAVKEEEPGCLWVSGRWVARPGWRAQHGSWRF